MATINAPFAANSQTVPILNLADFVDMPQFRKQFAPTYVDEYNWETLVKLGMVEEEVGGDVYYWQEGDYIIGIPVIGLVTNQTTFVQITYNTASHDASGTVSYGREGENVLLGNYLYGRIRTKDETTPGAHIINVTPIGLNLDGTAVTVAQLFAGLAIGQNIGVMDNGFTEGDFGQLRSIISSPRTFQNNLQNFSEEFKVSFNSAKNKTWSIYPFPTSIGGDGKDHYYHKDIFEMQVRMQRAMMLAMFNGQGGSGIDRNGKIVPITEGFYRTSERVSKRAPYSEEITKAYFDDFDRTALQNYATGEYNTFMGLNWMQKSQNFRINYQLNRPQDAPNDKIVTKLTTAEIGDNIHSFISLKIMNDPRSLGTAGTKHMDSALSIPSGKVEVMNQAGISMTVPFFSIRYKPRYNGFGEKTYVTTNLLGFNNPNGQATSTEDVIEVHTKASIGAMFVNARLGILSQKM